jgi:peroxiredoxin
MKNILLVFSLFITQSYIAQSHPERLVDFELYELNGETFSKENIKENSFNYFIYYNPTCGHCVDTFKVLNLKSDQIKKADVQIYTISANTEQLTRSFFEQHAPKLQNLVNVEILRDEDYKFADAFNVGPFPTAFLYNKNNKLIKVYEGTSEVVLFLNEIK